MDFESVQSIEPIDSKTVQITLDKSFRLLVCLRQHASIVDSEAEGSLRSEPAGTGPFNLLGGKRNRLVMHKNPNYWEVDSLGQTLPIPRKQFTLILFLIWRPST